MQKVVPFKLDPGRLSGDPKRSYTLPANSYTDPAVFRAEKEAIFFKSWQFAGHVEQVAKPGDYITQQILDQKLFVVRDKEGDLRAFYNVCQHRAHRLLEGAGNVKVITCPYHAWSYNLDGALRSARGREKVEDFDPAEFCLTPVKLEVANNFIFVNLDPDAAPLAEQAGDFLAEMREMAPDIGRLTHAHRETFTLKSNWKIVVDNFLECYHCPVAHPAFVDLVDMKTYRVVTHGLWSSHHAGGGKTNNPAYDFSNAEVQIHAVWWLWPNVCFLRYPGGPNMMVLHILPTVAGETFETYDFYFETPEPSAQQWEAIRYIKDVLQPEDIGIVESVQEGLSSRGYRDGRLMVSDELEKTGASEHGVHHFHSLLARALAG